MKENDLERVKKEVKAILKPDLVKNNKIFS
jgi:hypothetical protein